MLGGMLQTRSDAGQSKTHTGAAWHLHQVFSSENSFSPPVFFHKISVSLSSQVALKLSIYLSSRFHAAETSQITPCLSQLH